MSESPTDIVIHPMQRENVNQVAMLFIEMWPDAKLEEESKFLINSLLSEKYQIFTAQKKETIVGFIFASERVDYVEGTKSSPCGYIEGIYCKEEFRRSGVGAELLKHAVSWFKNRGLNEIGSDADISNDLSLQFHLANGFKEVSRNTHFLLQL